jgi:heme oxygenase (biliverdin-IX-beta and delta-forming)
LRCSLRLPGILEWKSMAIQLKPDNVAASEMDRIPGLRAVLRDATRAAHHRIDHHPVLVPLLRPGLSWAQYLLVLQVFLSFYDTLQPRLTIALERLPDALGGYILADRIAWLQQDLLDLADKADAGADSSDAASVASVDHAGLAKLRWVLPTLTQAPALVGALYVVEGSALGGLVIAKQLHATLGVDANRGARFFNGWGDATPQKWHNYWQFAALICPVDATAQAAAAAASVFEALTQGLDAAWAMQSEELVDE